MKNVLTVRPGSKPLSFVVSSSTDQAQHLKFISRLLTVEERLYHLVHLTFTIKLISSELYRKRRSTKSRLDYQPLFGKVARAPTPNLLLLIWTNRSSACLPAVANKLCDMKSDRFSGTSNQIPSTNEVMPDLNHSGIYNTQNSQQFPTWGDLHRNLHEGIIPQQSKDVVQHSSLHFQPGWSKQS